MVLKKENKVIKNLTLKKKSLNWQPETQNAFKDFQRDHEIIESLRLEGTNSNLRQPCPQSLSATSPQFKSTSRDGDSITSLGSCANTSALFWRRNYC